MPALEAVVVLIAGIIIKLLVTLAPFQGDNYRGVGWLWSTLIAGIGNGLSYFIGYIATLKPWEGRISPVSPCQPRRIRFRNWSIPPSSLNRSVSVTCDDVRPKRWHKPEVERLQAVHGFDTVSRFRMCFAAWGGAAFRFSGGAPPCPTGASPSTSRRGGPASQCPSVGWAKTRLLKIFLLIDAKLGHNSVHWE